MPSKVCIYCIAKNEGQFVDRFMDSVKDADLILIGDTGSTDDTVEKFKARGATVHSITVDPWRFDVARNKVIDLVPAEYDCLFSIDIDELIITPDWKQKLLAVWDNGKRNRIRYPYTWSLRSDGTPDKRFTYDKIHSRDFRWVSPCHEVLEATKPESGGFVDLEVIHKPDPTKSRGSYLNLLELAVKERPNDARMLHYYARELYYKGRWAEAKELLLKHSNWEGQWPAERSASCRFAAECALHLGDKVEAERLYAKGCELSPEAREPHIFYARYLQGQGRHQECYDHAIQAMKVKNKLNHYLEDRAAWNEAPYDLAGVSAFYIGKKEEAKTLCAEALTFNPADARLASNVQLTGGTTAATVPTQVPVNTDAKAEANRLALAAVSAWHARNARLGRELFAKAKQLDPENTWVKANEDWFRPIQRIVTTDDLHNAEHRVSSYKDAVVSVLITSFSRPEGALRASATALATASQRDLVEVLVATDITDPLAVRYKEMPELNSEVIIGHPTCMKWNYLATKSKGEIIVLTCDDVIFESYGWDQVLRDMWPDDGMAVMFADSKSGHEWCEFPVISRKMINVVGYAAYPKLEHPGLDTWWSTIGSVIGRLYYLSYVWSLRHNHYITSDVHDRDLRAADKTMPQFLEYKQICLDHAKKLSTFVTRVCNNKA